MHACNGRQAGGFEPRPYMTMAARCRHSRPGTETESEAESESESESETETEIDELPAIL